jgi:hypothetical protein
MLDLDRDLVKRASIVWRAKPIILLKLLLSVSLEPRNRAIGGHCNNRISPKLVEILTTFKPSSANLM